MNERYLLAKERLKEIKNENILPSYVREFFSKEAEFFALLDEALNKVKSGELRQLSLDELRKLNHGLYGFYGAACIDADMFESRELFKLLRAISAECKAAIPYAFEGDVENILIRMELLLLAYGIFVSEYEQSRVEAADRRKDDDKNDTSVINERLEKGLREALHYYVCDYTHKAYDEKTENMVTLDEDFATGIIRSCDLSDVRTLYFYGEYVTEYEERTLLYLNSLPYDSLKRMADTFTEGYRLGFIATNKDISKKKIVNIRFTVGFEPVIKLAVENFEKMGLKSVIYRAHENLLTGRSLNRVGYYGAVYDKQYDFEHKDDQALILDKKLITIRLEALRSAFEKRKKNAYLFGGPAVMEVFGEKPKELITREYAPVLSKKQQEMLVEYSAKAMAIQNEYIIEEERSFTIIAFPTPHIGKDFEKIFDEVIKLNTLDYRLYQNVQQKIIDALDKAEHVIVKGKGANKTDMRVYLHKLNDPLKETNFENCVADVNIPVGEVFTSPLLTGTEGTLNVSRVFLNELEYKNITFIIKDGMITDYSCDNFSTAEENRKYISDNVLFHHRTLPIGEFAIGTNTTAFVMARRFGIENVLPILIAEKTGPHFAFGDTCYSHEESVKTYNPDGKEIIAKDNECSQKRDAEPLKAYFNCHTDVTLPYDELMEISAVTTTGEKIPIIYDGRFVLDGTEILNEPLDTCYS